MFLKTWLMRWIEPRLVELEQELAEAREERMMCEVELTATKQALEHEAAEADKYAGLYRDLCNPKLAAFRADRSV